MGIEDAQRRLAAHAPEQVQVEPPPAEPVVVVPEPEPPPTLKALLAFTNGVCEPTVLGLKELGLLEDVGDALVYTFSEPPKASRDVPAGFTKIRLTKIIKGLHKRQMLVHGEPDATGTLLPLQHVLLSWVSALSAKPMSMIDELSGDDCDALMSVAQWIKHDRGNV